MSHAPGPWEVTLDKQGVKTIYGQPGMDPSQLLPVAVLSPGVCRQANARLIAAAPDLLEACRDLIELACDALYAAEDRLGFDPEQNPLVRRARDTVAKAEGKEGGSR